MFHVFIDGQNGTTGLQIRDRLERHPDIAVISIDEGLRKDHTAKHSIISEADAVILCLPDEAAIQTAALIDEQVLIDASTAHRTHPDWTYGLPELSPVQREHIRTNRRIANPGCYPTGFTLAIRPLIDQALLPRETAIFVSALSGYSGGGKAMIEQYSSNDAAACRPYAFDLNHKHLPEMTKFSGLDSAPIFLPHVGNFYQGMLIEIGLKKSAFTKPVSSATICEAWQAAYAGEPFIQIMEANPEDCLIDRFLDPEAANGSNQVELLCFESQTDLLLVARLDNLGKGAAGAAVQNLNIALGLPETTAL